VGDRVFLDVSNLHTTRPSHKLAHRFVGPYSIKRKVGTHVYELRLPPSINHIHPVFHVVKLKPAPEDPIAGRHTNPPPDPVPVDGEEEYKVKEIMNSRFFSRKLQFLVAWKGYGQEEWSWVNEKDLHAPELVEAFYQKNPGAPWQIRCLTTDFARSLVPRRGVMSGDDPLTRDPFPHKHDGRAICLSHSRRLSSPEGLCNRFLAIL
jgi:hypothetical protein